ncbi:MAG: hypothetical protein IJU58_01960 [Clostridia bacterium]|nr:hypothetical protein [Clostridia bacterium]
MEKEDFNFDMSVLQAASTDAIVMNIKRRQEMENYNKLVAKQASHKDEQHVKLIIEDSGRVSCVQYAQDDDEELSL